MKKFFIFVCASMFCMTSFAETVHSEDFSVETVIVEAEADFSMEAVSELTAEPNELMGPDSDGFIPKGTIYLTRVVSGIRDKFYLYNKRGVDYVSPSSNGGPYFRLERRMHIYGIDYKY